MENDKNGAVAFGKQSTLTPFTDTETEGDLVDTIRKIISGENPMDAVAAQEKQVADIAPEPEVADIAPEPEVADKELERKKLDGRSRDYKATVKRITTGEKKKSGKGLDGRSKSYKETMKRINVRRSKQKESK